MRSRPAPLARAPWCAALPWALAALALGAACDDGGGGPDDAVVLPPDDARPADGRPPDQSPTDMIAPPDCGVCDAAPPDAAPDAAVCPAADGVLPGDTPLVDRNWRIQLDRATRPGDVAPTCASDEDDGEPTDAVTAGAELRLRIEPALSGEHLLIVSGRYSALYTAAPCDPAPEPMRCVVVRSPFADGATRARRVPLLAGAPIELIVDAPADERAGPVVVVLYPPVPPGESCAPIGPSGVRPSCAPGFACEGDVCGPPSAPVTERVGAWSDGQSLRIEVEVEGDDGPDLVEALWAEVGDGGLVQLQTTAVERRGDRLILRGFAEDARLAAAARVTVELIDDAGHVGRVEVDVEALVPAPAGAPCDRSGMRDVCAPGAACVSGRCVAWTAGAWRAADGARLSVAMPDAPADPDRVIGAAYRIADAPWRGLPPVASERGRRWGEAGLDLPPAEEVSIRIQQPARPPSLPRVIGFEPLPLLDDDDPCDPAGITDACGPGLACIDRGAGPRCGTVTAPVIDGLQGWFGVDALGLEVRAHDPEDDIAALVYAVFDAATGDVRAEGEVAWVAPVERDARFSVPAPWGPRAGDTVRVTLVDAQGLESAPAEAPLLPARPVPPGAPCDPLGALTVCRDPRTICAAAEADPEPLCQALVVDCPDDWRPFALEVPVSFQDSNRGGLDRAAGRCGGGETPETVYVVEAPETGRWRVSVEPPQSVVYVREHCAFSVSERACSPDSAVEVDVVRGERYFVFVDGPGAEGGRFTLEIEPVARPGVDR